MDFLDFNYQIESHEYDSDTDDKLSKRARENRTKLKVLLNAIIEKVLKNESFIKRNNFNI